MKKIILIGLITLVSLGSNANDLELKGIIDFDLISAGYTGKAIHLIVNNNITDLSDYGIGVANNGNGGDGQEFTFPNISLQGLLRGQSRSKVLVMSTYLNILLYFSSLLSKSFYNFSYIVVGFMFEYSKETD
jgi:hypothetical protein